MLSMMLARFQTVRCQRVALSASTVLRQCSVIKPCNECSGDQALIKFVAQGVNKACSTLAGAPCPRWFRLEPLRVCFSSTARRIGVTCLTVSGSDDHPRGTRKHTNTRSQCFLSGDNPCIYSQSRARELSPTYGESRVTVVGVAPVQWT
jgi:hypothetical protein